MKTQKQTDKKVVIYTVEDTDLPDFDTETKRKETLLVENGRSRAGHFFISHENWNLANTGQRVRNKLSFEKCLADIKADTEDFLCFIDLNLGRELVAEYQNVFEAADLPPRIFADKKNIFPGLWFAKSALNEINTKRFGLIVLANTSLTNAGEFELLKNHPVWATHQSNFCLGSSLTMITGSELLSQIIKEGIDAFLEAKGYGRKAPEKILSEFEGFFLTTILPNNAMIKKMPHNYGQATTDQKKDFRHKLSKIFRASCASIDTLTAVDIKASNIWDSLKGLAGATAKHSTYGATVSGTTGIRMGGVAILVAAHCPTAEKWLKKVKFVDAPGNLLLSAEATVENEKDLWEKLNAFFEAVIPKKGNSLESNVKLVTLAVNAVTIKLKVKSFSSENFQTKLDDDHDGDACRCFRTLKGFLDENVSKCNLVWNKDSTVFKFQTKLINNI